MSTVSPSSVCSDGEVRRIAVERDLEPVRARLVGGLLAPRSVAPLTRSRTPRASSLASLSRADDVERARVRVDEERRAERHERDRPRDRRQEAAAHARGPLQVDHLERRGGDRLRRELERRASPTCAA